MTDKTLLVMGFNATQTDDELIVHGVPIFCACARGDVQFDELWVKAAVSKAMRRAREGYMPPMHVRHHEPDTAHTDSVRAAGHFRITGTGPVTIGGARRTAILADLVFTDPSAAHEALTKRLPYRSVEIFDVEREPSIDSLALLDHEAPYLELPMLQVNEVADERTPPREETPLVPLGTFRNQDSPPSRDSMVAFSRTGNQARLTFREDTNMAAPTTKNTEAKTDAVADVIPNPTAKNFADDEKDDGENMADDDKDDGENMEGETALDVGAVVKAIEAGTISVADMDAILAAIQSQSATEEPEEEVEAAPAQAPSPVEAMKADRKTMSAFAALQGKVDALEANNVNRDKTAKEAADVADAVELLRGLPLGSGLEGKLVAFRTAHGADAFGDYVQSLKQNTAVEPGDRSAVAANFTALGGKIPDVAMKYQDKGTEAVTQAANFSNEWHQLIEAGSRMKTTEENYVAHNMAKLAG